VEKRRKDSQSYSSRASRARGLPKLAAPASQIPLDKWFPSFRGVGGRGDTKKSVPVTSATTVHVLRNIHNSLSYQHQRPPLTMETRRAKRGGGQGQD